MIAAIASIEIPAGQWLDVLPMLLAALTTDQAVENQKVASLETIGYICEGVVGFFKLRCVKTLIFPRFCRLLSAWSPSPPPS